jgi:hypothetical protein
MIEREELLAFEFYKKKPFKGSDKGARYMITKKNRETGETDEEGNPVTVTVLAAYSWPEPFSFEATKDEVKEEKDFPFSEEGLDEARGWLNEIHDSVAAKAQTPLESCNHRRDE